MMMGRMRSLTASSVDLISSSPRSTLIFANSTIRIAFLADRPMRVINPICAYTLLVSVGANGQRHGWRQRALMGTASITASGTDQLSYNAARNRNTKTMQNVKIYTVMEPALISS